MYSNPGTSVARTASGLNFLAGLWELISPWVVGYSLLGGATANAVIIGIIVAVLAAIRFLGAYGAAWLSGINGLAGVWLVISPWVMGYSAFGSPTINSATINSVIVGDIMLILGAWSASASRTPTA